jgi:hypothetical protein
MGQKVSSISDYQQGIDFSAFLSGFLSQLIRSIGTIKLQARGPSNLCFLFISCSSHALSEEVYIC